MISRIDLRGRALVAGALRAALPRAEFDLDDALDVVRPIIDAVRSRGADALREFGHTFDGVTPTQLRVPADVLQAAADALDPQVRAALEEAIRRVRIVHTDQLRSPHVTHVVPGGTVTQRWIPVERVGLYVPAGQAVYPSSVIMNVVPAQVAGVGSLAVSSPPQRDNVGVFAGYPHPTILAAAHLLGMNEVYAVGGAQAVAMFAYGAAEADGTVVCEPVALVTGPGNVYVASAKRAVRSVVGIDAEAGPTEIAILADAEADPACIAADMISQAEHDELAASVLVTDSEKLAEAVESQLVAQLTRTKHHERVSAALRGRQSAIVLVDDLAEGLRTVNAYGAEHLEVHTTHAADVAGLVTNAGAVFVGPHSPVSLGDYVAGSNHVLPTSGTSAYASGLGVHSFLRSVQVVQYSADALAEVADAVVTLAHAEDLPAHGDAVLARTRVGGRPDSTEDVA
ncbi:MAG: histidinol dehydrogenase [Dermatophilaceae bacterium]